MVERDSTVVRIDSAYKNKVDKVFPHIYDEHGSRKYKNARDFYDEAIRTLLNQYNHVPAEPVEVPAK